MYHRKCTALTKQIRRCLYHVQKLHQYLMPRNVLWGILIFQPMIPLDIGRITCNRRKTSRFEKLPHLPHIAFHNRDLCLQSIHLHTTPRHIRAVRLHLKSGKMSALAARLHQHRDHACPGPKIDHGTIRRTCRKICKQHCIHAKAEYVLVLNDIVATALQIIDPLTRFQPLLFLILSPHRALTFLPCAPDSPVPSTLCRTSHHCRPSYHGRHLFDRLFSSA